VRGSLVLSLLILAVLAALVAADVVERRRRRRLIEDVHVFECRVRAVGRPPAGWRLLRRRWSRRTWAWWTGDVLVIRRGPVLDRRVRFAAHVSADLTPCRLRPFGTHGIAVRLALPGDRELEVAANDWSRTQLVGPYLAAAVTHLPKAPVPRRFHR
jgi:hypothetical protein